MIPWLHLSPLQRALVLHQHPHLQNGDGCEDDSLYYSFENGEVTVWWLVAGSPKPYVRPPICI
jgi:hypothetical protein